MSAQFDPPSIVNEHELRSFAEHHSKADGDYRRIVLTGENNTGKSFLLRVVQQHLAKEGYIVVQNVPHSPKENFNPKVTEKDLTDLTETLQKYLDHFSEIDPFRSPTKGEFTNQAYSHAISLLLEESIFSRFSSILREYFIKKGFFGRDDVQVSVERREKCRWTHPELSAQDPPLVLCVDGEHFHWSGNGVDRIVFLVASIVCTIEKLKRASIRNPICLVLDEPETGLSVKNQRILDSFLAALPQEFGKEYIQRCFISTHSYVFVPTSLNNQHLAAYSVEKQVHSDNRVSLSVKELSTEGLLQQRFDVLGLAWSDLMLDGILLVEGKHEKRFLTRIFEILRMNIVVLPRGGSASVIDAMNLVGTRHENLTSLFFGLLDAPTDEEKRKYDQAICTHRLLILDQHGIEFAYPGSLVGKFLRANGPRLKQAFESQNSEDWEKLQLAQKVEFLKGRSRNKELLSFFVDEHLEAAHLSEPEVLPLINRIKAMMVPAV